MSYSKDIPSISIIKRAGSHEALPPIASPESKINIVKDFGRLVTPSLTEESSTDHFTNELKHAASKKRLSRLQDKAKPKLISFTKAKEYARLANNMPAVLSYENGQ